MDTLNKLVSWAGYLASRKGYKQAQVVLDYRVIDGTLVAEAKLKRPKSHKPASWYSTFFTI